MNASEAESEIFDLRKKAETFLRAGDIEEVNRLQLRISEIQLATGAVKGAGEEEHHERTA